MPDNVRRWISAGLDMALVGGLMTDGYTPAGLSGSLSAGNAAALSRMYGVKTGEIVLPEPAIVPVTGDDTRLGVFQFDGENSPTFALAAGEVDQDITNKIQGTTPYSVGSYYDLNLLGPLNRDFDDMLLWLIQQAKSRVSGNRGSGFRNLIIPRCQMTYLGGGFSERSASTYNYQITVDVFDTFPWGGLIGNNAFGKSEGHMFEWFTNKRPQMLTIIDNTSTNTYTLNSVPWADGNGNVRFIAWRNGVVVGMTGATGSVSVATDKTVDISGLAGRTSGDKIVIFAEVA